MIYKIVCTVEGDDGGVAAPAQLTWEDGSLTVYCMSGGEVAESLMRLHRVLHRTWEEHLEQDRQARMKPVAQKPEAEKSHWTIGDPEPWVTG